MSKLLIIPLIVLYCVLFPGKGNAQVSFGTIHAGPYGGGGSIAVPLIISQADACYNSGNLFELWISDVNGNFAPGRKIGEVAGTFTSYINGEIPAGMPQGNYKLRVKTTNPASSIDYSGSISILTEQAPVIAVNPSISNEVLSPKQVFGWCGSSVGDNKNIILINNSSPGATTTLRLKNEKTGNTQSFPLTSTGFDLQNITQSYYTIILTSEWTKNGKLVTSTRSYVLSNIQSRVNIQSKGDDTGCLDPKDGSGATITYSINITGTGGIQDNYPGSIYKITWGDGKEDNITHCQLIANNGVITHNYKKTSCGEPPINIGTGTVITNSYRVSVTTINPFCQSTPAVASTYPKVYSKPIAEIGPTTVSTTCINAPVVFANASSGGTNADCTITMNYKWYVDGVLMSTNKVYTYPGFSTPGMHEIKLVAASDVGLCAPSVDTKNICVQLPPKPSFNFNGSNDIASCAPSIIKPSNTSIIDDNCNKDNTYFWAVTGPAFSYANGTSNTSKEPEFKFTNPGIYKVTLSVKTASCGTETTPPQTIVINSPPLTTLSPDAEICNLGAYNFNNTTSGPTKTVFKGTEEELSDTYTWKVTGGEFSFTDGTTEHSKYPNITFKEYKTYIVTVTHKNSCSSLTVSQELKFTTAPVIDAGPDQSICYDDAVNLNAQVISGTVKTMEWLGGNGNFNPNRNTPNAVYTPTPAERATGQVELQFKTTTTLIEPCNEINDYIIITIRPKATVTSPKNSSICTNTQLNYAITSNLSNTTFTWTATGSAHAGGFAPSGSGNTISALLTNTDPINNATVTYIITPANANCPGIPFTLTVTVTPVPVITAIPASINICSRQSTAIILSSNLSNTKYIWSSTADANITGNSKGLIASSVSSINDVLFNTGTVAGKVKYLITPISANGCPGISIPVEITVNPMVTIANAGPDESICNTNTYTLHGNEAIVGNGEWTLTSTQTGVTFTDKTKHDTQVSGLQSGQNYIFTWTITGASSCAIATDAVMVTVNTPTVGGTTTGTTTVCAEDNGGLIELTGNTGTVLRWESSTDHGTTWQPIASTANNYAFNNLMVSTIFRAVVKNGSCAAENSTSTSITVNPKTILANAGTDQMLCNADKVTLTGNAPLPNTGLWTLVSPQTGITFTDATAATTTVNGLTGGQIYVFRWTITGVAPCPNTSDEVVINNLAPIQNNTISNTTPMVCSGQTITISGTLPTGGDNTTYTYTWESSTDNGGTWTEITGKTGRDLSFVLTGNLSFKRIVHSSNCASASNIINISALPPVINNIISSTETTICTGNVPAPLTGTIPQGGGGSYNYQWQSSTDHGTTWIDISGQTAPGLILPALNTTTSYRRLAGTTQCDGSLQNISNSITIIVNPDAKAEFTWTADNGCAPFTLDDKIITAVPYPDRNALYSWYADGTFLGNGITFPGHIIQNNNTAVVIKLVVTSSLGCTKDEMTHTFRTQEEILASFTTNVSKGCGKTIVKFTNTTPAMVGAIYDWDFGNGNHSNLMNPPDQEFLPDPSGDDLTYFIKLKVTTNCGFNLSPETSILVQSKPIARLSPDKTSGCADLTVTFTNNSPVSKNTIYLYDFGDGSPKLEKTERSFTYTYTKAGTFPVTMIATNDCGADVSPEFRIVVIPNTAQASLVVSGDELKGCAPHTVNFINSSSGASSYIYNYGDGSQPETYATTQGVPHTFTKGGTYTVTLTAINNCGGTKTDTKTITVDDQPIVSFDADHKIGCAGILVQFKNKSKDAVAYTWDFGDGTPTSQKFEPEHTYTGAQEYYTVTLTAVNSQGCPTTVTQTQFIHVVPTPKAAFNVLPSHVINIPNYTFSFEDESTNTPDQWEWDFGDKTFSTSKNPNHTYADTGSYKVVLKVTNQQGCFSDITKTIRITGVPGQLYVANSFMPASGVTELKEFKAKGSGILKWRMSIFDKWGQEIWQTTRLEGSRPVESWDGTFKGVAMPQGLYFWKIEAQFINGTKWKGMSYGTAAPKTTGSIHLIR